MRKIACGIRPTSGNNRNNVGRTLLCFRQQRNCHWASALMRGITRTGRCHSNCNLEALMPLSSNLLKPKCLGGSLLSSHITLDHPPVVGQKLPETSGPDTRSQDAVTAKTAQLITNTRTATEKTVPKRGESGPQQLKAKAAAADHCSDESRLLPSRKTLSVPKPIAKTWSSNIEDGDNLRAFEFLELNDYMAALKLLERGQMRGTSFDLIGHRTIVLAADAAHSFRTRVTGFVEVDVLIDNPMRNPLKRGKQASVKWAERLPENRSPARRPLPNAGR